MITYTCRNNEEKDLEYHAQISDMAKQVLEQMEVMREQYAEQGNAIKRMSAKLMEMKVEAETCNDSQVTVLANIQEEPQTEEKSDFLDEDNFYETEIASQS
ncbi:hypothetical protein HAX54_041047 [Datura stramonium]|uniref:Uncharacterized protein n=1 Tax=Datura stramonium TaxID=4076 RepID=A0ABS8VS96_DATST|nr:hypothetical protein [Datura stramonium]